MATFKVGQRVRIKTAGEGVQYIHGFTPPPGQEGTVVSVEPDGYLVAVDNVPKPRKRMPGWWIEGAYLEPIIRPDPAAREFIEGLKKLVREPAPLERHAVGEEK
jgi:hypothetical protein